MYSRFTDEIRIKQIKERDDRAAARSEKSGVLITNVVLPAICGFLDKNSIARFMQTSKQTYTDIKTDKLHAPMKKKVSLTISSMCQTEITCFLSENTRIRDLELIGDFSKCLPTGYKFPEILRLKKTENSKEIPVECFTNVRKLYMSNIGLREIQPILERTPNLIRLSIDSIMDTILQSVKTLTKLEHFSVGYIEMWGIDSAKFIYDVVKNCTHLKKLTLYPFTLGKNNDYIFEYFERMGLVVPGFLKLKIGNVTHINRIAKCFPNLEMLNIKASAKIVNFKNFKHLKRLSFANEIINDNITDMLVGLPDSITELYIHGTINELKHLKMFMDAMCTFLDNHPNLWSLGLNGNILPMSSYIGIIHHLPPRLRDFGTTLPELTDPIFLGACAIMAKRCPHLRYVYCYNGNGYREAKYITDEAITKARKILETTTIVTKAQLSVHVKHG